MKSKRAERIALLKLIGQRPGSASTLAGLRHFNAMGAI